MKAKTMNMIRNAISFAALLAVTATAFAQDPQKFDFMTATGSDGATYDTVHKQWVQVCPAFNLPVYMLEDAVAKKKRNTNGTVENLQALLSNQADMAYIQADAAWSFLQRDPNVQNLRVLAVLYPEAVHVITTTAPVIIKVAGKVFGTNDVPKQLNTVEDLKGLAVAAWGGSAVTGDIMGKHILGSLRVVEVSGRDEAFAKLKSGEVQAVVAVGGYPVSWVEQLDSTYKLLPFPKALRDKVGSTYPEAKLTYTKMMAAGIESGETTSMLVAQNFGPKKAAALTEAFDCLDQKLETLRDTRNMHPVWKKVDLSRKSNILPPFPFVRPASYVPVATPTPAAKPAGKAAPKK